MYEETQKYFIYVKVPEEYWDNHEWSFFYSDEETLTKTYGVVFEMVGLIFSKNIVFYQVELNTPEDELFFLIKTGFTKASFNDLINTVIL